MRLLTPSIASATNQDGHRRLSSLSHSRKITRLKSFAYIGSKVSVGSKIPVNDWLPCPVNSPRVAIREAIYLSRRRRLGLPVDLPWISETANAPKKGKTMVKVAVSRNLGVLGEVVEEFPRTTFFVWYDGLSKEKRMEVLSAMINFFCARYSPKEEEEDESESEKQETETFGTSTVFQWRNQETPDFIDQFNVWYASLQEAEQDTVLASSTLSDLSDDGITLSYPPQLGLSNEALEVLWDWATSHVQDNFKPIMIPVMPEPEDPEYPVDYHIPKPPAHGYRARLTKLTRDGTLVCDAHGNIVWDKVPVAASGSRSQSG